jgi:FKBP12-rapamycin complex-associated protein
VHRDKQLIARIHSPVPQVARLIHDLLTNVGKEHPQALVYPLSVASKSQSSARADAANAILDKMRKHRYLSVVLVLHYLAHILPSASLVEAALLVSRELIRVAILWHEMWHEGLKEALQLYFGNRDVEGMFKKLEPLHAMLAKVWSWSLLQGSLISLCSKGPETLREVSFQEAYGRDLQEALEWCKVRMQSFPNLFVIVACKVVTWNP